MDDKTTTDAGSLKPGRYVMIDDVPCVVRNIEIAKTGKHGHAKCRIEAISLINDEKKIIISPAHDKVDVPIVDKRDAQVLSIAGDKANVMDMTSYETFDLKIPEELKDKLKEGVQIMYWSMMGQKVIKQVK